MLQKNIVVQLLSKIANETSIHKTLKHVTEQNSHTVSKQKYLFDLFKRKSLLKKFDNEYFYLSLFKNKPGILDLFILDHKVFLIFKINNENFFFHFVEFTKERIYKEAEQEFEKMLRDENNKYIDSLKDKEESKKRLEEKQLENYNFIRGQRVYKPAFNRNKLYNLVDVNNNMFSFSIISDEKTASLQKTLDESLIRINIRMYDLAIYNIENNKLLTIKKDLKKFYVNIDNKDFEILNFAKYDNIVHIKTVDGKYLSYRVISEIDIPLIDKINSIKKFTKEEINNNIEGL